MEYNIHSYDFISVELPLNKNFGVFVTIEWTFYVYRPCESSMLNHRVFTMDKLNNCCKYVQVFHFFHGQ